MQPLNKEKANPKEFAQEHWKEILAASGTLAGAVILLLIKYHRNQQKENGELFEDLHLDALEGETLGEPDDTVMFLETGVAVKEHIPDADQLISQLQKGLRGKARRKMKIFRKIRN